MAAALDVHDDNKPETTVEAALIALNTELSTLRDALEELELAVNPTGTIIAWTGSSSSIPAGYLHCNGQSVSRTTYSALFDLIGTAFDSDPANFGPANTFKVPDYRDMFLRGAETDAETDGTRGVNTYQEDTFEEHKHSLKYDKIETGKMGKNDDVVSFDDNNNSHDTGRSGGESEEDETETETRPKNWSVHFLIKY